MRRSLGTEDGAGVENLHAAEKLVVASTCDATTNSVST